MIYKNQLPTKYYSSWTQLYIIYREIMKSDGKNILEEKVFKLPFYEPDEYHFDTFFVLLQAISEMIDETKKYMETQKHPSDTPFFENENRQGEKAFQRSNVPNK